jgi:GNAT superfamily N-acetyltransferase
MTIREATVADAPAIATLGLHFAAAYGGDYIAPTREALEGLAAVLVAQPACTILVAQLEETGALVGFIALAAGLNPFDGAHLLVEELAWWVEPDARRAGQVGARLLSAAEDWARANGLAVLKMVAPHQSRVARFYERYGYVPVETSYTKRLDEVHRPPVRRRQGPEEAGGPVDRHDD